MKALLATRIPLKAIADQTGFSCANHLQRLFKSHFGMTLSEYRMRLANGHGPKAGKPR